MKEIGLRKRLWSDWSVLSVRVTYCHNITNCKKGIQDGVGKGIVKNEELGIAGDEWLGVCTGSEGVESKA